jgi:hypothetical protein
MLNEEARCPNVDCDNGKARKKVNEKVKKVKKKPDILMLNAKMKKLEKNSLEWHLVMSNGIKYKCARR